MQANLPTRLRVSLPAHASRLPGPRAFLRRALHPGGAEGVRDGVGPAGAVTTCVCVGGGAVREVWVCV